MPELTVQDVELFTKGRLLASSVETARILDRAYATVRTYCGWHVSPVIADDVATLDGPDHVLLGLPTLHLVTLTEVVEDGVTLNLADLTSSVSGRLLVKKMPPRRWTSNLRAITVTMTHGFASAPDFNQAVLELVDGVSLKLGTGSNAGLKRYRVDDVEREWQTVFTRNPFERDGMNHALLDQYRLIPAI